MRRFRVMVTPAASEQVDRESTTVSYVQKVAEGLQPHAIMPKDPIDPTSRARGEITLRVLAGLTEVLTSKDAHCASSRESPLDDDTGPVLVIVSPKCARIGSSRTASRVLNDEATHSLPPRAGSSSFATRCRIVTMSSRTSPGRRKARRRPVCRERKHQRPRASKPRSPENTEGPSSLRTRANRTRIRGPVGVTDNPISISAARGRNGVHQGSEDLLRFHFRLFLRLRGVPTRAQAR